MTTNRESGGPAADGLPPRLFSGFRALVGEVDAATAAFSDAYPGEVTCRAGCSECCRSFFEVGLLEGLCLSRGVAALPAGRRGEAVERSWAAVKGIDAARRDGDPFARAPEVFVKDLALDHARSLSGVFCPLLDDAGGCSIYPHRPVVCRYYGLPRLHPAHADQHDYCYLNFRGLRARGEEPDVSMAMDVPGWRRRLDGLEGELAAALFGSARLRYSAPIAEFVAASGRTMSEWAQLLAPLTDPVFVAVRRFFEILGARDEARRNVLDPYAREHSADWAAEHLADGALAADLDTVVDACLGKLSGERIDAPAVARILRSRGPAFRRHAHLVALQVATEAARSYG